VGAIVRALADDGPLSADQLRERVTAVGVRAQGQALYHLLFRASLEGLIARGPVVAGKHAYVLLRDWLGEEKPVDRDKALVEVARRYLAGHGPATDRDLAKWAGISLGDARSGLAGANADRQAPREPAELPPPKLLGAFEPVLLGWVSRQEIYGDKRSFATDPRLLDPFAMVRGRAAGHWRLVDGEAVIEPFSTLSKGVTAALAREARDVKRFLG